MARPAERFAAVVGGPGGRDDDLAGPLDEAALCLAAHARGDDDDVLVDEGLALLDTLAVGLDGTLTDLLARLFGDIGLAGDVDDYDAPENSYLDAVVARRRGLPITLAVATIEIGRRAGVALAPVAMPGHFLVRHEGLPRVLIDCFAGGRRLTSGDCEALLQGIYGPGAALHLDWLRPVGPRVVLARMLANLVGSAERRGLTDLRRRALELAPLL